MYYKPRYVVLDPVMLAKSGDTLLAPEAVNALKKYLLPLVSLVTPNLPEAAVLLNFSLAKNEEQMYEQGLALFHLG
ncbi:MAG: bifunctional hydroxymethylpyrimidine kinase/phosphomethylpyrimidine kinase, partial [Candidatus Regiella insecticola]|nr:bifunctional hydroxymethylpyrimidine kinase/phosphomethylpyrimidine kinase [Candidatus Regiella insecticola]